MEVSTDVIIVGGGPAGLTAAQYCARGNLRTLLFEGAAQGGQALHIDNLENYPGVANTTGFELAQNMEKQAINFGAKIENASVKKIEKKDNIFFVETDSGNFSCYAVIAATGAKHRKLMVPGEGEFTGRGVSYCAACDAPFFKGKKILAIGGGDSACDESVFLSKIADRVVLIHRKEMFRAQKSIAERVLNNKKIEVRFNTKCIGLKGGAKLERAALCGAEGNNYEEDFDAAFIFIGSDPQTSVFPDVKKESNGYIITDFNMATSTAGLFAAGDVRATPFRQIAVSVGDGAIAAHAADFYIDGLKGQSYK
jgi:thioredoxin reductase (NADPH)